MKTLKHALLMLVLLAPLSLTAQMDGPGGGFRGRMARRHMPSVDDQVKHLTEVLSLTESQRTQVKTILQDQRDQMKNAMKDPSQTREDNFVKMREIHQQSSAKIRDLLTDEQKTKYDKLEQERRQKMQERHGGGESGQGQGPPPSDQQ